MAVSCYSAYVRTYRLTAWSRVLLSKLTGSQLDKKFPAYYGTRKSITAIKGARQLSLTWARSVKSMQPHPTSWISILSTHLCLGLSSGSFPQVFLLKPRIRLSFPNTCYLSRPCHSFRFGHPKYLVSSAAFHYVVFSTSLLPRPS